MAYNEVTKKILQLFKDIIVHFVFVFCICFVLCTQLNFMKTTSSIALYRVGTIYHLQWSTLALVRASNAFYRTLTCDLLLIVRIFNLL